MPIAYKMKIQEQTLVKRISDNYLRLTDMLKKKNPVVAEKYTVFSSQMKKLQQTTEKYYKKDEDGNFPALSKEDADELITQYKEALNACREVSKAAKNAGMEDTSPLLRNMNVLEKVLKKDGSLFNFFTPGMTMAGMIAEANTYDNVVKVRSSLTASTHGQSNSRFGLSIKKQTPEGVKVVDGLFTKEKRLNPDEEFDLLFEEFNTEDKLKPLFDDLNSKTDMKGIRDIFFSMNISVSNSRGAYSLAKKYENDPDISRIFEKYRDTKLNGILKNNFCKRVDNIIGINNTVIKHAGIKENSNLDQRNCAMTAVADLLDMGNVIAKSEKVLVKTDEGTFRGTFMELAEGSDVQHLQEDDPLLYLNTRLVARSNDSIKSGADLQVLDFICGNIDRHMANFTYQVKNGQFVGVQGFDNDMSFGLVPERYLTGDKVYQNFTSLRAMRFVTEKTARKIEALTEGSLREKLAGYQLSEKEITAACNRLKMLKNSLNYRFIENPDLFEPRGENPSYMRTLGFDGKVDVLNDDQLKMLRIDRDLALRAKNGIEIQYFNIFSRMLGGIDLAQRARKYEDPKNSLKNKLKDAEEKKQEDTIPLQNYYDRLSEHLNQLKAVNHGMFVSSAEFDNVLNYGELVQKELQSMKDNDLTEQDVVKVNRMFENLSALACIYMDQKVLDGSLKDNERSISRYEKMNALFRMCDNFVEKDNVVSDRDLYQRMSFLNRTGAYRRSADSERIADTIKSIRRAQKNGIHNITDSDKIFARRMDGISSNAWKSMIMDYRKETEMIAKALFQTDEKNHYRLKVLPEHVNNLTQSIDSERLENAMNDLKNAFTALDGRERFTRADMAGIEDKLKTAAEEAKGYMEKFSAINFAMERKYVPGLLKLNEIISLSARAEEGDCTPSAHSNEKIAEKLAERMLDRKLSRTLQYGDAEAIEKQLCNHEEVRKLYSDIMKLNAFGKITEKRSEKELNKLLGDDRKLIQQWNKGLTQKNERQVSLPVVGKEVVL